MEAPASSRLLSLAYAHVPAILRRDMEGHAFSPSLPRLSDLGSPRCLEFSGLHDLQQQVNLS